MNLMKFSNFIFAAQKFSEDMVWYDSATGEAENREEKVNLSKQGRFSPSRLTRRDWIEKLWVQNFSEFHGKPRGAVSRLDNGRDGTEGWSTGALTASCERGRQQELRWKVNVFSAVLVKAIICFGYFVQEIFSEHCLLDIAPESVQCI